MIKKSVFLVAMLTAGVASAAQLKEVNTDAFVKHPTHCKVYMGELDYEGEALAVEYSQALADALGSAQSEVAQTSTELKDRCRAKAISADARDSKE